MIWGLLAGMLWAADTLVLGMALSMDSFAGAGVAGTGAGVIRAATLLAPFVSTFLHDAFSAVWSWGYNSVRGNIPAAFRALKTPEGKRILLAAIIGGPVGMTGYVLTVANLGPSIGAVASAVYPAVGAVLAFFFLKEKMAWYRWVFLLLTLLGVYGLSFSPEVEIANFWLGLAGSLMCAFGWGIEAVIVAGSVRAKEGAAARSGAGIDVDSKVCNDVGRAVSGDALPPDDPSQIISNDVALLLRQTTSALVYGAILLPLLRGWGLTVSLFSPSGGPAVSLILLAGLLGTASYLCYYKAISLIGASKAMALNITYAAWAVVFGIVFLGNRSLLHPVTLACTAVVLLFGVLAGRREQR